MTWGSANTARTAAAVASCETPSPSALSQELDDDARGLGARTQNPPPALALTGKTSGDLRLDGMGLTPDGVLAVVPGGVCESRGDGSPAAFSEGLERLYRVVAYAVDRRASWLERMHTGLVALLAFLDEEPGWARPLILEAQDVALSEASLRVHEALGAVLNAGRGQVIVGSQLMPPTSLIAELLSCAVLSVIRARMLAGDRAPLVELAPSLMEFIVEPYLGAGAERADQASAPMRVVRVPREARVLPVRAHPRIVHVLRVIAATPGLSSRDIELAVSAKDTRGRRISEVLKPLRQRGLIENARVGQLPRHTNAWHLTSYGQRALELVGCSARSGHVGGSAA